MLSIIFYQSVRQFLDNFIENTVIGMDTFLNITVEFISTALLKYEAYITGL